MKDVARVLTDLEFFSGVWSYDENTVRSWWVHIEKNSGLTMADAYRHLISNPVGKILSLVSLADLLNSGGYIEEAAKILESCVDRCRGENGLSLLQSSLQKSAHIHMDAAFRMRPWSHTNRRRGLVG